MTKDPASASHGAQSDEFETISSDALAQTSGGYMISGGGNPTSWWQQPSGWFNPQPQYYTVQRGDNLTNIAKGNHESLNRLLTMNPQFQSNPNLIYPGQKVLTGYSYPSYPSWYF